MARSTSGKSCEYCSGKLKLYQRNQTTKLYVNTLCGRRLLEIEANDCPPFTKCMRRGKLIRAVFPIKFCPECGRQLERGG